MLTYFAFIVQFFPFCFHHVYYYHVLTKSTPPTFPLLTIIMKNTRSIQAPLQLVRTRQAATSERPNIDLAKLIFIRVWYVYADQINLI